MRRNSHLTLVIAGFAAAVLLAVAGGLAGLVFLASLAGLTLGKHPEIIHEVIEGTPVTHT